MLKSSPENEGFENRTYDIDHVEIMETKNGVSMRAISESSD